MKFNPYAHLTEVGAVRALLEMQCVVEQRVENIQKLWIGAAVLLLHLRRAHIGLRK